MVADGLILVGVLILAPLVAGINMDGVSDCELMPPSAFITRTLTLHSLLPGRDRDLRRVALIGVHDDDQEPA